MCEKTFGQKVKKLSKKLEAVGDKEKKFGNVHYRKPEEVDSN